MEIALLLLAVLFLLWRVNSANDEAFPSDGGIGENRGQRYTPIPSDGEDSKEDTSSSAFWDSGGISDLFEDDHSRRWHDDDCDISRAMWDPSCPLYHAFHHDDWHSSSSWDDSWSSSSGWDDSWSSSSWDSGSSSWDSWSSSSWDS